MFLGHFCLPVGCLAADHGQHASGLLPGDAGRQPNQVRGINTVLLNASSTVWWLHIASESVQMLPVMYCQNVQLYGMQVHCGSVPTLHGVMVVRLWVVKPGDRAERDMFSCIGAVLLIEYQTRVRSVHWHPLGCSRLHPHCLSCTQAYGPDCILQCQ
jgi:hypothetical protein